MSEEFHQEQYAPRKRLFPLHYWLVILAIAGGVIYYTLAQQPPFVNPKIASKPYVWPQGCEKKEYYQYDYISESCASAKYEIVEWKRYGWTAGNNSRGFEGYYRVKNDAVSFLFCKKDHICKIGDVISDIFIVDGENR